MYGGQPGQYDPSMGGGMPPQGFDPNMGGMPPQGMMGPPMGGPPMGGPPMMGGPPQGMYDPMMGQPPMGQPPMMGGPPPGGMYDPQMMGGDPNAAAQAQAEAELERLEKKKKDREEKDKQKEVDHITHMMRTGQRNQEDNASCANLLCAWGIMNGLMWAVPLLGDSWWTKIWHGFGVDKLVVSVGLFNMEVHVECKDSAEDSLCRAATMYADHDNGHWAMLELKEAMCLKIQDSCPTMTRLYNAGFPPLVGLPLAAGFEVLAVLLLYFYWHGKPTSLVRKLAANCACLAPVSGVFGLTGWMIMSPYLQQLPRFWAAQAGKAEFANSSLFGMKETFTLPAGWCCLIAFFAMMSSFIRFFVQWTLPVHLNEPDPYGFDESSRLVQEAQQVYDQAQKEA